MPRSTPACCPESANIGARSATLEPSSAEFGPSSDKFDKHSDELRPRLDQIWSQFDQVVPDLGQLWSDTGNTGPKLARNRPILAGGDEHLLDLARSNLAPEFYRNCPIKSGPNVGTLIEKCNIYCSLRFRLVVRVRVIVLCSVASSRRASVGFGVSLPHAFSLRRRSVWWRWTCRTSGLCSSSTAA